jgi:hypothetical protein
MIGKAERAIGVTGQKYRKKAKERTKRMEGIEGKGGGSEGQRRSTGGGC